MRMAAASAYSSAAGTTPVARMAKTAWAAASASANTASSVRVSSGSGRKPERRFRDDGQRPLGADDHPQQIRPGIVGTQPHGVAAR